MTALIMILMVGVTERVVIRFGFKATLSAGLAAGAHPGDVGRPSPFEP